jgi:hypothetical protein
MGDENKGLGGLQDQLMKLGVDFAKALETNIDPKRIKEKFVEVENAAFNVARQFGVGRDNILNIKASMTDLVDSAKSFGLNFKDVSDLTQSISANLGRNVLLNKESGKSVLATAKVLQDMGQDFGVVAGKFKDVGVSYQGVSKDIEKATNAARKIGVSASGVVKGVVDNLDKLNKYNFKGGVEGLSKMVAQSKVLRVNMDQIFNVANEAFNPDGAIEMAAAMQRLGVTQSDLLDPLRLMDLSANDPGELMNQIGKMSEQFVQLNKDGRFEVMPGAKRQLMEIAGALKMDYNELVKMSVGSKELDMKLSKIKFPATFTEEQRNFIANMAEIGPGGEMTLRVNGEELGIDKAMSAFADDKDALDQFMKDSEPKTMEQLAKEQLTIMDEQTIVLEEIKDRVGYGMASSKGFETLTKTQKDAINAVQTATKSKTFSSEGIRQGIGYQSDELIKALSKGDMAKSGEVGLKMLGEVAKIPGEIGENIGKAYEGLKKSDNPITQGVVGLVEANKSPTTTMATATPVVSPTNVSPTDYQSTALLKEFEKQKSTPQNFTYNGKLDVNFTVPPGVNSKDVERIINDIVNSAEFKQKLAMMANDPTGKKNPSEQNMTFPR